MGAKYTEAQKKASIKYQENKVKVQILLKPEQRQKYHDYAKNKNTSLTKLIVELLEKEIES